MSSDSAKTVVLGLGNILHTDDAVGPQAIARLREHPQLPRGVDLVEGGTLGLELLPYLWDCRHLLVLDAVDVGQPAGTLVRMSGDDLNDLPGNSSVHQLGVSDLVVALKVLARQPPELVLLGLQPASTDWGTDLSPLVADKMNLLVESAIRELCGADGAASEVAPA